jgi:hypothetical protein
MTEEQPNPQEFENDSLRVSENPNGTLTIEWDPEDPKYSFMNNLTEDQITAMLEQILQEYVNEHELEQ